MPEQEWDADRLYVTNLTYGCSEEELQAFFAAHGEVVEAHIPLGAGGQTKGFGFVRMKSAAAAQAALRDAHLAVFQGRVLHVQLAKKPPTSTASPAGDVSAGGRRLTQVQKQREAERRSGALHEKHAWHSSYLRSEAATQVLAARLGVSEGAILNAYEAHAGELAVKVAVAQTALIHENVDFFRAYGVDLHADANSPRSNTMLLIKNLPVNSDVDELKALFSKFGALADCVLVPSATVALVVFTESQHARQAFRQLAYRRYKQSPLFLEWAPLSREPPRGIDQRATASALTAQNADAGAALKDELLSAEDEREEEEGFGSLFVKNLAFTTSEDDLKQCLIERLGERCGLRAVRIATKRKQSLVLSQGFGFVEFASASAASAALDALQDVLLHGHKLEFKRSEKRVSSAVAAPSSGEKGNRKLVVRNVAFQATKKELLQLFGAYGSVKHVRLPKGGHGQLRGFAFVEFSTHQEAQAAMAALRATHFYGRHLVIEWAQVDQDQDNVDASRKRAMQDHQLLRSQAKRSRAAATDEDQAPDAQLQDLL